jgi:hypothetical protein
MIKKYLVNTPKSRAMVFKYKQKPYEYARIKHNIKLQLLMQIQAENFQCAQPTKKPRKAGT